MAKKHRSNGARQFTIPLALVAGMLPGVASVASKFPDQGLMGSANEATRIYLGWDFREQRWSMGWMKVGLLPLLLGAIGHKFIGGRLGVNRALSSAGIPFIRF